MSTHGFVELDLYCKRLLISIINSYVSQHKVVRETFWLTAVCLFVTQFCLLSNSKSFDPICTKLYKMFAAIISRSRSISSVIAPTTLELWPLDEQIWHFCPLSYSNSCPLILTIFFKIFVALIFCSGSISSTIAPTTWELWFLYYTKLPVLGLFLSNPISFYTSRWETCVFFKHQTLVH